MDSHKKKKPTKAEMIASIPKHVEDKLKEGYIKNMVQGFTLANQMLLDYINDGHTIDEVKLFVEKNVSKDGIETMEKVIGGNANVD
jgi:hypothetical protein